MGSPPTIWAPAPEKPASSQAGHDQADESDGRASLAAVAGTLHAHITQLDPEMGFELILPMFAALIVGGVTNVYGAVLGGLLIGLSESFAVAGGLSAYRSAISFMILILVLTFRPQGIVGEKERDD